MKKVLSMFLTVTMLAVMLMGVNVPYVGAVSAVLTENASTGVRDVTVTMGSDSALQFLATGKYTVKATVSVDGQATEWDFGTVTKETVLGKDFINYNFNEVKLYDASMYSGGQNKNYFRIVPSLIDSNETTLKIATGKGNNSTFEAIAKDTLISNTAGSDQKVYKFTFYAYSDSQKGTNLVVAAMNNNSQTLSAELTPSALCSADGVPHKVDVLFYTNSSDGALESTDYTYMSVYIDGVTYVKSTVAKGSSWNDTFELRLYFNFNATSTGTSHAASDWHVSYGGDVKGANKAELLTRDEAAKSLFVTPTWRTTNTNTETTTKRTDAEVVYGVNDFADSILTAAVTSGERTVTLEGTYLSDIITAPSNTNVTAVKKADGSAVEPSAYSETNINDVYLSVNGVYVTPTTSSFTESTTKPFNAGDEINIRVRRENFATKTDADGLGGLNTGYYKYTGEPRGTFTFNGGAPVYASNGYYGVGVPKDAYKKSRIMTLDFDMYIPSYHATTSNYLGITHAPGWDKTDETTRAAMDSFRFVTDSELEIDSAVKNGRYISVEPNSWYNVKLEYDFSDAASSGKVTCKVFVDGSLKQTITKTSDVYKNMLTVQNEQLFDFIRLYIPNYRSVGVMNGKWYYGRNESYSSKVTDKTITGSYTGVSVDQTNHEITSDLGDDALLSALSAYSPVYTYEYADDTAMNAAYDAKDGTYTVVTAKETYKGKLIKKWAQVAGAVTYGSDGAPTVDSSYKPGQGSITSFALVDGEPDSLSMTVSSNFNDTKVYSGITTSLADLISENPDLRAKTLTGFAVTEDGKLPKVYTLVRNRVELKSVSVSDGGLATLTFDKLGTVTVDAKILVAAYGANGGLLGVTTADVGTLIAEKSGTNATATLQCAEVSGAASYKAFVLKSFDTLIPLLASSSSN